MKTNLLTALFTGPTDAQYTAMARAEAVERAYMAWVRLHPNATIEDCATEYNRLTTQ